MKIGILVPDGFPDQNAVGRVTHMMAKGLLSQDQQVCVLARWSSGEELSDEEAHIRVRTFGRFDRSRRAKVPLAVWITSALGLASTALLCVASGVLDCTIIYGISPLFLPAAIMGRVFGRRMVFVQFDLYRPSSLDGGWKHRFEGLYRFTETFIARSARMLLISESELLIRKFKELAPGVALFPKWPPSDSAFFSAGMPNEGRRICDLLANVPLVIYVGGINRVEGVDVLICAMKEVVALIPEAQLVIVGSLSGDILCGPAPDYHALPRQLGIPGSVRFLGRLGRESVRNLLAAADCLVLPKREHETNSAANPIKLGEYLASGRPVAATRVCGIERWLKDGEEILLCRAGDQKDLARVICQILRSPEWARQLGERGQKAGVAHCDYTQWGKAFLEEWNTVGR